ncbi:MAG: MFS transporter [Candidatus Tectimicrobiota bacterium]|nr:MAG: MFS transporter [Candidatus Tectomicrobia bacterium]
MVALGGLFLGGGMVLVSRVHTPWQFYLAYGLVAGIGMSAAYVPCNATVVKWFVRRRSLALGLTGSGASLGIAAFPPLSEALIARYGWRTTYLLFGLMVLGCLNLLACFLVRDPEALGLHPDGEHDADPRPVAAQEAAWTPRQALRSRPFWLLSGVMVLSLSTIPSAYVHLPQHAADLGLGVPRSTFIMLVGLSALLGNLLLGRLAAWLTRRGALLFSLSLGTLAFGGFSVARSALLLYAAAAAFGFYYGTYASLFPAVVGDFFGRQHAGTLTGLSFALGSVASAIGPAAMGLVADRSGHYLPAFLGGTAINALATGLFVLARPPQRR